MKKGSAVLVSAALSALLLCGCNGYTEIENMDILTSHYIYQDGDRVQIGGGVANVRSFSDAMASDPINLIRAEGANLNEAVAQLQRSADHKLFYGGMRAVVIGGTYAESGIGEFVRYIRSTPEQRMNVDVFTSDSEPEEIVKYKAINDFSGGFAAESIMRTLNLENLAPRCTLGDILAALAEQKVGFAVPNIVVDDDIMRIDGYSIFQVDKKIAFLTADEATPLGFFHDSRSKARCYADAGGRTVTIEAEMVKKDIHVEEGTDGNLSVTASMKFDLSVADLGSAGLAPQEIEAIKASVCGQLKENTEALLQTAKDTGCDFLGFYKQYQTKKRAGFYQTDWSEKMKNMQYRVDIQAGAFENNLTNEELWR